MKWLLVLVTPLFVCSPLHAQGLSASQKALQVRELERWLHTFEDYDVDKFVSDMSHLCPMVDDPRSPTFPLYQAVMVEEKNMEASGIGENHPRAKALREKKALLVRQISELRVRLHDKAAAQLEELRK